jgi:hypothetical protein
MTDVTATAPKELDKAVGLSRSFSKGKYTTKTLTEYTKYSSKFQFEVETE